MAELFASGWIVDLILLMVAIEAITLGVWRWRGGRLPDGIGIAATLAAGACLLLALRAALTGSGWPSVGAWLALALVAHVFDLGRRFRAR